MNELKILKELSDALQVAFDELTPEMEGACEDGKRHLMASQVAIGQVQDAVEKVLERRLASPQVP